MDEEMKAAPEISNGDGDARKMETRPALLDQRATTPSTPAGVESVLAGGLQELRGKQGVTSRFTLFSVVCTPTRSSVRTD